MTFDLVFPQGNEERLCAMARELGFSQLLLCYPLSDPLIKERKEELCKLSRDIAVTFAIFAKNQQEVQKARKLTEHVVAPGVPGTFEDKRVRYVIDYESGKRKDFVHHRNAGLTQVFVKHAIRTGKTLLVNAAQLHGSVPAHVVLGRMMQNNMLYRKYGPSVRVVSGARAPLEMRAPRDLQNLLAL